MYFKAATCGEHEINMSGDHVLCAGGEVDTLGHEDADQRMALHLRHCLVSQGLAQPVNSLLHKSKDLSSGPQHPCERQARQHTPSSENMEIKRFQILTV